MNQLRKLPSGDKKLVQIVDAALADATQRAGHWLACRLGCTQCCVGTFAINQLDALRLQHGLSEMQRNDPATATRIRERARASVIRLKSTFPGDASTGILHEDEASELAFADFANDEPCPVLDPATGACDLYAHRPMTCRVFGPPVRGENGLGVCELCFQGASDAEITACEMKPDPDDLESHVVKQLARDGLRGNTIISFCLGRN